MRALLVFAFSALLGSPAAAQSLFVNTFGGTGTDFASAVALDGDTVYVAGSYQGTVDFDPGSETANLSPSARFVAGYAPDGSYRSAFKVDGDGETVDDLAVGLSGRLFVTGEFQDDVEVALDAPGGGASFQRASGSFGSNGYLAAVDRDGSVAWALALLGTGESRVGGVAVDPSGNVFVAGDFEGTVDFASGSPGGERTSVGGSDLFVASYTAEGAFRWVVTVDAPATVSIPATGIDGDAVAVDAQGNVFVTGDFTVNGSSRTIDFDPAGPSGAASGNGGFYLVSYTDAGAFRWADIADATSTVRGASSATASALAVGPGGDVYAAGTLRGIVDFGTGDVQSDDNRPDALLVRYSNTGTAQMALRAGGRFDDDANGVGVDAMGNAYVAGRFFDTADFDPSSATESRTSRGGFDAFVASYTPAGALRYVNALGSSESETATALAARADGASFTAGYFSRTIDFDPDGRDNRRSNGGFDAFVAGYTSNGFLPVELTAFTAQADGDAARLTWTTASETGNSGFEVQHEQDGAWRVLEWINGKGTTLEAQSYSFRTAALTAGTHRFRLRQVDFDGAAELSSVVEVTVGLDGPYRLSEAHPNPARYEAVLTLTVARAQPIEAAAYDALGRRVAVLHEGAVAAGAALPLRLSAGALPAGLYFVRVRGEHFSAVRTLVVAR